MGYRITGSDKMASLLSLYAAGEDQHVRRSTSDSILGLVARLLRKGDIDGLVQGMEARGSTAASRGISLCSEWLASPRPEILHDVHVLEARST